MLSKILGCQTRWMSDLGGAVLCLVLMSLMNVSIGAHPFHGSSEAYLQLYQKRIEAGLDTVVELAQRVPMNLHAKMVEVNAMKKLVRRLPAESQVADWVNQAKRLPRRVSY